MSASLEIKKLMSSQKNLKWRLNKMKKEKETKQNNTPKITAMVIIGILAAINLIGIFFGKESLIKIGEIIFIICVISIVLFGVLHDDP